MFKLNNPVVTSAIDNLQRSFDPRDQGWLDCQQAKAGLKPFRPFLEDRMSQIDPRSQEWQDIHGQLNRFDPSQVPTFKPNLDPIGSLNRSAPQVGVAALGLKPAWQPVTNLNQPVIPNFRPTPVHKW